MGHSQSFSDLKSAAIEKEGQDTAVNGNVANGTSQKSISKRRQPLRRRSTATWSHATSENRQKLLQDAVAERRIDSFLTLHESDKIDQDHPPVYISEIKHKTMNADFQHFDLSKATGISRKDRILVRIWAARSDTDFAQLVEVDDELPTLVWLGKSVRIVPNIRVTY